MADFAKHGIHPELEAEADRLIRDSLRGVTARSEKSDILTPWKEQDRKSREVYNATGFAEATTRQGMFHRSWNPARPELNSVDGSVSRMRRIPRITDQDRPSGRMSSSMADFVQENLRGETPDGMPIALSFGEDR